jgi:hypothetical protein
MEWLVFVLAVAVLVLVVVWKLLARPGKEIAYPYMLGRALFSPAERSFLGVLDQAIGNEFRVFGKVRVADVVSVVNGFDRSAWRRAFNRISSKHFDFILCSRSDLSVVAAIELNDQSHQQHRRKERDVFISNLCNVVDLPLIQMPAQRTYSVHEVRAMVMSALDVKVEVDIGMEAAITDQVDAASNEKDLMGEETSVSELSNPPCCPKCSSPMVLRKAKAGAKVGQMFWGCSTYPKCRGIILIYREE